MKQFAMKVCKGDMTTDRVIFCYGDKEIYFIREDVLEDIKAELQTLADDEWNQKVMADKGLELAIEIIENYISRKE